MIVLKKEFWNIREEGRIMKRVILFLLEFYKHCLM
jgi:hypothetical protein